MGPEPISRTFFPSSIIGAIDIESRKWLIIIALSYLIAVRFIFSFQLGYSHFFGRDGVSVVFDKKDNLDWLYVQCKISF